MKKIMLAGLVGLFGFVASGLADTYVWNNADGNWNVGANWNVGGTPQSNPPGSSDNVYINRWKATIDSDVGSINTLYMGFNNLTGYLDIVDGANLTVLSAAGRIGRSGYVNSAGVINMTGGTLQYGAAQDQRLILGLDSTGNNEQGSMTISGGTFAGQLLVGQNLGGGSADIFRVEGDSATIGSTAITATPGLDVRSTGRLQFKFNETGISTMTFADTGAFHGSSVISISGSDYTGGADTFTLINCSSFSGTPVVSLSGFEDASYDWDTANGNLTVTVIPEPATMGLLGMVGAGFLAVRRFFIM